MWGVWCTGVETKEECRKLPKKGGIEEGKKMRINTVTKRWHNFANSAQEDVTGSGAKMQSAAVLTHKLLGVWRVAVLHICRFRLQKPRGNASLRILLPRERWAVSPPRVWFFSSSQRGLELSRKSELIITPGAAFSEFGLGLKTVTTWAAHQSKWKSNCNPACQWKHHRNYTVFRISREHGGGLYGLFHPLRAYFTVMTVFQSIQHNLDFLPFRHQFWQ